MNLGKLNDKGIEQFSIFLDSLYGDAPRTVPSRLLTDPSFSKQVTPPIKIEYYPFKTRYAVAEYLFNLFKDSGLTDIERDQGLWAWLSLFFFDLICPIKNGRREVRQRERYFPELKNYKRYYKHILAGSYLVYSAHQDHPERTLALLCVPPHILTDVIEHLAGRKELLTNKGLISAATALYYDAQNEQIRRGAGGKGNGSPKRLAAVMQQFDVTWDLYSLERDDVIQKLPDEFERFRKHVAI